VRTSAFGSHPDGWIVKSAWRLALGIVAVTSTTASANDGDRVSTARSLAREPAGPAQPAEGGSGEPHEPGPVNLFPRLPMARAAGWILPPGPAPSGEEAAEARTEEYLDNELERDRLQAGEVDAWYYELGRAMRNRFRPSQRALERERRAGMNPFQILYDELRRYAHGPERPIDVPGQALPEQQMHADPTDRRAAVEREAWDVCNALNAPVTWYRVVLRVTHNPEGELSAVWVEQSSGWPSLDEAALRAVRQGSIALRAPPQEVVGEREAIQSDWAFEMGDVATPMGCYFTPGELLPIPQLQCVDDPVLGLQCAIFGRGIIRTRLQLLRVIDGRHRSPEERRAARRRDADRPRP
jgi:TonB family protein